MGQEVAQVAVVTAASIIAATGVVMTYMYRTSGGKNASSAGPNESPSTDADEDKELKALVRGAFVDMMRETVDHAIKFFDQNPGASYADWIRDLHAENINSDGSLDSRLLLPQSQHLQIYTQVKAARFDGRSNNAWSRLVALSAKPDAQRASLSQWKIHQNTISGRFSEEPFSDQVEIFVGVVDDKGEYGQAVTSREAFELGPMSPEQSAAQLPTADFPEPHGMALVPKRKLGGTNGLSEKRPRFTAADDCHSRACEKYVEFWKGVNTPALSRAEFLKLTTTQRENIDRQDIEVWGANLGDKFGATRLMQVCELPKTIFEQRHNRVVIEAPLKTSVPSLFYRDVMPRNTLNEFPLQPHKLALKQICKRLDILDPTHFTIDPHPKAHVYEKIMETIDLVYYGGKLLPYLGNPRILVVSGEPEHQTFRARVAYELSQPIIEVSADVIYVPPVTPSHRQYAHSVLLESNLEAAMVHICHELTHIVHFRFGQMPTPGWPRCGKLDPIRTLPHGRSFLELLQRMWGLGTDWFFTEPDPRYQGVAEGHKMILVTTTSLFFQVSEWFPKPSEPSDTALTVTTLNKEGIRQIAARMDQALSMGVIVHTFHRVTDTCVHNGVSIEECWTGCDGQTRDAAAWNRCWRKKALAAHPDKGGQNEDFHKLKACRELIEKEKGNQSPEAVHQLL